MIFLNIDWLGLTFTEHWLYLIVPFTDFHCTPFTPLNISSNQHCIPLYSPTVFHSTHCKPLYRALTSTVHHCTVLLTSTISHCTPLYRAPTGTVPHCMALYRALTSTVPHCTTVHGTEQHCNSLYPICTINLKDFKEKAFWIFSVWYFFRYLFVCGNHIERNSTGQ